MTDADIKKLTLADAVQLLASRKISPRELAAAVVSRIDRVNPEMRAFITVIPPENSDQHAPPLHGVPLTVKDLYDAKGVPTTAGSKVFADRIKEEDATAV